MSSGSAEDFNEEIGAAIDDIGMLLEVRHGVDHTQQLHDTLYTRQIAKRLVHDCQQIDAGETGILIGLVHADIAADLPRTQMSAFFPWPLPGKIEHIPFPYMRDKVRDG